MRRVAITCNVCGVSIFGAYWDYLIHAARESGWDCPDELAHDALVRDVCGTCANHRRVLGVLAKDGVA